MTPKEIKPNEAFDNGSKASVYVLAMDMRQLLYVASKIGWN